MSREPCRAGARVRNYFGGARTRYAIATTASFLRA
jgi:hypothetical protein